MPNLQTSEGSVLKRLRDFWGRRCCILLAHGQVIPRFYGWAGYDEGQERVYVMPIGINFLYSFVTWLYHEVVQGCQSRSQSYTYHTAWKLGEQAGTQKGYMVGYVDGRNQQPNRLTQLREKDATLVH